MKDKGLSSEDNQIEKALKTPPNLRQQYLIEKARIMNEIGDLEQIRLTLGLSQRRLCQLLLVDPSAWTRWLKSEAPPHVYQALSWLVQLKTLNPEAIVPTDMAKRVDFIQANTQTKIKDIENNIAVLERTLSAKVALANQVAAPSVTSNSHFSMTTALKAHEEHFLARISELEAKIAELVSDTHAKKRVRKPTKKIKPKAKLKLKTAVKTKAKPKKKPKTNAQVKRPKAKKPAPKKLKGKARSARRVRANRR